MKWLPHRFITGVAALAWLSVAGCGESKLDFKDLEEGSGAAAKKGDLIEVHYTGKFRDGRVFESSLDSNQPYTFLLGRKQVIVGWDEGIPGMKVGGKRRLLIPAALAYGEKGHPPAIPPNADLVFEIDLLGIYTPLPGGLYVRDLVEGKGDQPVKKGYQVEVDYTGWLDTGKQFDSSKGKEPLQFKVGSPNIIAGMSQGIEGMKVGGKRKIIIPPGLAYGDRGRPPIPPKAELTFEIELVKIR